MEKIRWGLLGAGMIIDRWLKGFRQVEDAELAAVASRTRETAQRQAEKYGIPEAMTYDEMLERKDIDVVYIPVPHTAHKELAIRAMTSGHHVLVEKPAGVNAAEWDAMTDCAKLNGVFLMEAIWTRFMPAVNAACEEVRAGTIGDVRCLQSNFSFRIPDDGYGRLTDPNLAGGALLDVGIYNLTLAHMVFQRPPVRWVSLASIGQDEMHLEVDEQETCIGQYDNGALAVLSSGIRTDMLDTGWIFGTKGSIRLPRFWSADEFDLTVGGETKHYDFPVPQRVSGIADEGYQFEIMHVNQCIREGRTESPAASFAVTREILSEMDALRAQWGLKYPFE